MKWLSVLICVCLSQTIFAQDVTIPATLTCKPGRIVAINATTNAANVVWIWDQVENADVIPTNDKGTRAIFNSDTPGVYNVLAIIAIIDKDSKLPVAVKSNYCIITVGVPPPKPDPDNPPDNTLDDFQKGVQREYKNSKFTKASMAKLAEFYDDGAKFINDPTVTNTLALEKSLQAAANTSLGQEVYSIRTLASDYMKGKLPKLAGPLTDDLRKQWADAFKYLAASMRKVSK